MEPSKWNKCCTEIINLHHPNLILHLQGQVSQFLVSHLHLAFLTLEYWVHAGYYAGGLSELCHKNMMYGQHRLS